MATPATKPFFMGQPGPMLEFNPTSFVSKSIQISFASDKSGIVSGGIHSLGG